MRKKQNQIHELFSLSWYLVFFIIIIINSIHFVGNSYLVLSNNQTVRYNKCDIMSTGNHIVGNHMQQDNFGTSQSRSQMPLPGFRQPCQPHQPQPSTDLPPQLSHSQAGADSNYSGALHLKQK
jgi:hypothetical protein